MTTYLDSSVILRPLLRQPDCLDPALLQPAVTCRISRVEVFRTLDRWRLRGLLEEAPFLQKRSEAHALFRRLTVLELEPNLLDRAESPLPVPLAALDALHLVTAQRWKYCYGDSLRFATHDRALADAARACGFEVVGA